VAKMTSKSSYELALSFWRGRSWREGRVVRRTFWTEGCGKDEPYTSVSPSKGDWIATSVGKSNLKYKCTITQHSATAELQIERGNESSFAPTTNSRATDAA
jgi:hypothetical protein